MSAAPAPILREEAAANRSMATSPETLDQRVALTREKNRRAVEMAERRSKRLSEDLKESEMRVKRALAILRRAS